MVIVHTKRNNTERKAMVFDHAPNVQVLEEDCAVQTDKRMTKLMRKVIAPKLNTLVDTSCYFVPLLSLCSGKGLLVRAKEARITNLLARRECSEVAESNINSNASVVHRKWLRFDFDREAGIPLARAGARDSKGLNPAFKRTVQLDVYVSDFKEAQLTCFKDCAGLRKGERVVSFVRAKAWKACLTFALFSTAKEVLKSFIKSAQNILQNPTVNIVKLRSYLFDFRELPLLVNVADGFSFKSISVSALLQASIVEFTAQRKGIIQSRSLSTRRIDAIFECTPCYILVCHARHAPSCRVLVRTQKSPQVASEFVPHYSTSPHHRIQEKQFKRWWTSPSFR